MGRQNGRDGRAARTQVLIAACAAHPGQHLPHGVGMRRRRISRRCNAVGDAYPADGADRHRDDTPPETALLCDRREVVGAGLEQRHPALQELIAGEVAVVVRVRRGRCDVVVVDQTHEIVERSDRPRVVEGEPVAVGEHAARRTDVVQVDALKIVGGVVSPLPDASSVEPGFVGSAAVRVDGQPGQQRPQGVDVAGGPAHREQLSEIDARGVEKVGVEVHRDARIGQLRYAPQHAVAGELIHDRRLPAVAAFGPNAFATSISRPLSAYPAK